jgi:hypothetical protein
LMALASSGQRSRASAPLPVLSRWRSLITVAAYNPPPVGG